MNIDDIKQSYSNKKDFMLITTLINNAKDSIKQVIDNLSLITIESAIASWVINCNLSNPIKIKYYHYMQDIIKDYKISIYKQSTLSIFSSIDHYKVIGCIQNRLDLSEKASIARVHAYRSFINYFNSLSNDSLGRIIQTYNKLTIPAMNKIIPIEEFSGFLSRLSDISHREYIVALMIYYFELSIHEVLDLKIDDIDLNDESLCLKKNIKGTSYNRKVPIQPSLIGLIKGYMKYRLSLNNNSNFLFVTRNGRVIVRSQLRYSFNQASGLLHKITPRSLRMLKRAYNNCDILNH